MDSFEITLFKDSNGNQIHLNELTLDASLQIKEVLDSLIQIVKFENEENGLNLKLSIENCCAAFKIQGEETEMEVVHKKITDVFDDTEERINEYVNPLKVIKDNVLSDSTSEVKFLKRGNVFDIKPKFSNNFRNRKNFIKQENNFKIEFIKGKLEQNGGKKPNFHLVAGHDTNLTIQCKNYSQALKVNSFLYKDIMISAWSEFKGGRMHYQFADFYRESDLNYYSDFKDFFKNLESAKGTEAYHLISAKLREYYDNKEFISAKKFIRLFCNKNSLPIYLNTILINSKAFRSEDNLEEILNEIEDLLTEKIGKIY